MSRVLSPRNAGQLSQSYLEISRYLRSHCVHPSTQSRFYHTDLPLLCLRPAASNLSNRSITTLSSNFVRKRYSNRSPRTSTVARASTTSNSQQGAVDVIRRFQQSDIDAIPSTCDWTSLEQWDSQHTSRVETTDPIHIYGYVTGHRLGKRVDFLTVVDPYLCRAIQVVCPKSVFPESLHQEHTQQPAQHDDAGRSLRAHTPVLVTGTVTKSQKRPPGLPESSNTFETTDQHVGKVIRIGHIELQASALKVLNEFPSQLVAKHDTNFPPEKRHLQFRTDAELRANIRLRSKIRAACTSFLIEQGFDDIETPLLFKSTPEGAREFVVPTRRKGFAYALPQSPQQYKQVLMSSGIPRYFQFARCFRDEDLRADRQPEFTQLDLEISFATRETVMSVVESIILDVVWPTAQRSHRLPSLAPLQSEAASSPSPSDKPMLRLPIRTYQEVMAKYGSDKPDPRLGVEIVRIDDWVSPTFKRMLTDIEDPIVEMICITTKHQDPRKSKDFVVSFMDLPSSSSYLKGKYGMAGISIYDPSSPLCGLAAFGHEAAAQVEEVFEPMEGDILVAQVRPNLPHSGGSTVLGNMRRDLLQFAIEQDLVEAPQHDSLFWVVDFPLFSPSEDDSPGQEGQAGICCTHHPFTAPRNNQDLSTLLSDPLTIVGDHYDLVINGTEVGGGSRRIHHPQLQELIFRDVLKMRPERVEDFRHLLNALETGCPPHAGLALGFDRLMALILDKTSVREVIAFPKWGDGEDKFVGSPSQLTASQLNTYHLQVVDSPKVNEPRLSIKA